MEKVDGIACQHFQLISRDLRQSTINKTSEGAAESHSTNACWFKPTTESTFQLTCIPGTSMVTFKLGHPFLPPGLCTFSCFFVEFRLFKYKIRLFAPRENVWPRSRSKGEYPSEKEGLFGARKKKLLNKLQTHARARTRPVRVRQ